MTKPIGKAKEKLWGNIIDSINDIWASIQFIIEKIDLIKYATKAIEKVKTRLRDMPKEVERIIHFLNSKNKYEL